MTSMNCFLRKLPSDMGSSECPRCWRIVSTPRARKPARTASKQPVASERLRQNADALRQGLVAGIPTEVPEEGIHDDVVDRGQVPHVVPQIGIRAVNLSHDSPTERAVDARA